MGTSLGEPWNGFGAAGVPGGPPGMSRGWPGASSVSTDVLLPSARHGRGLGGGGEGGAVDEERGGGNHEGPASLGGSVGSPVGDGDGDPVGAGVPDGDGEGVGDGGPATSK